MTSQFVLTCGSCRTSHQLSGDTTVMAAEMATFVAAHRDHAEFSIQADIAIGDAEAAD